MEAKVMAAKVEKDMAAKDIAETKAGVKGKGKVPFIISTRWQAANLRSNGTKAEDMDPNGVKTHGEDANGQAMGTIMVSGRWHV